ncbi:MAG: ribulose-phosphate 3-epimerase [Bdellovibrionota bacterium]
MNNTIIAPSILSADPLNLEKDILDVEHGGADWHHVDVMDGHFVPNLTFGLPLIRGLKKVTKLPLDVHIMVSNPDEVALSYVDAGADILTFHVEAATHAHRLVQAIKAKGCKAGVAINPGTMISSVFPLLPVLDLVLVMSVNPGFGGQQFIPESTQRIKELSHEINRIGRYDSIIIEIDGGITSRNAEQVRNAGARALVAGSYVYNSDDRCQAIYGLR